MPETTPRCFAHHMGLYLCEPTWLMQAVALVRAGAYPLVDARPPAPRERLYEVAGDGVAVIPISGPLFKGGSKFSSAPTVEIRRAVRQAREDPDVRGILLHIDSPGGHVAGIQELADEVRATDKVKPVHAHLDDLGASAAYWVASQARHVTANATAQVGSIGVVAVVEDTSGAAELEGVKVHVVATGARKGDFAPGVPVTEDALAALREEVADTHEHFLAAVTRGRGLRGKRLEAVVDGRTWIAGKAVGLGLIDAIASEEDALGDVAKAGRLGRAERRGRAAVSIRLAGLRVQPVRGCSSETPRKVQRSAAVPSEKHIGGELRDSPVNRDVLTQPGRDRLDLPPQTPPVPLAAADLRARRRGAE